MTDAQAGYGPFQTDREAATTAAVRAVYAAFDADPGPGKMHPHSTAMLTEACEAAGVELGDYDRRVLDGIGNWGPETCAVIAGIIRRASGADGAVTEWALAYTHRPAIAGLPSRRVIQPYPDEPSARAAVAEVQALAPEDRAAVARREIGPWNEVPDA